VSTRYSDYSDHQTGGIWRPLNRFLFALIVVAVATIAGYQFLPEFTQKEEQERVIESLQAQIEQEKQVLARHRLEEALLQNEDPEFLGIQARDYLNLRKPNETIYRLEMPKPDTSRMHLNK
jgi:cell division protein FtsB